MSAGYKVLSAFVLWFVTGFCVLGLSSRLHPDWYISFHERDVFVETFTVVVWPLTALAVGADAMMPPRIEQ